MSLGKEKKLVSPVTTPGGSGGWESGTFFRPGKALKREGWTLTLGGKGHLRNDK